MRLSDYRPQWFNLILGCAVLVFAVLVIPYGISTGADMSDIGAKAFLACLFGVMLIVADYRRWQRSAGAPVPGGPQVMSRAKKIGRWGIGVILASFLFFGLQFLFNDPQGYLMIVWGVIFVAGCIMATMPVFVFITGAAGLFRLD